MPNIFKRLIGVLATSTCLQLRQQVQYLKAENEMLRSRVVGRVRFSRDAGQILSSATSIATQSCGEACGAGGKFPSVGSRSQPVPPAATLVLNLGLCEALLNHQEAAEPLLLEAEKAMSAIFPADNPTLKQVRARIADFYEKWGKADKAAEWKAKA